jgi:predicted nucleic acid-binding protein
VTTFVFDASAVLRYIDKEAGASRVREIIQDYANEFAAIMLSAVQWGEIASTLRKRYGGQQQESILGSLQQLNFNIVPADAERAVKAAAIRVDRKMAYADAFAVELTLDSQEHVLVTADYDFKAVDDLVRIEFLPAK